MVFNLTEQNSLANQFLLELRNREIQKDRQRFRNNMERLGAIMAYEISRKLDYEKKIVHTPLADTKINVLKNQPVLITVLRAGLPYFQGFVNFFDKADSGFIGAWRKEGEEDITINLDYLATPSIEGREVILIDPMLATGRSFVKSVEALLKHGTPSHIYMAAVVTAPEGLAFIKANVKVPFSVWTCALDEQLNEQFYIVPGLGDAGDLCFGVKM